MINFQVKIEAESLNAKLRGDFRARAGKTKRERQKVTLAWLTQPLMFRHSVVASVRTFGVIVKLTRVGPRKLDDDNLAGSLKAVRDAIAAALGVDDRDPKVQWAYSQYPAGRGNYWVEVSITSKPFSEFVDA